MEHRVNWTIENRIRGWILLEENKDSEQTDFRKLLNGESRKSKILRYLADIEKKNG